jgi:hypothetical protein
MKLDDMVNQQVPENEFEPVQGQTEPTQEKESFGFDYKVLLAKTGEGDVEQYLNHPLNFNRSKAVSQILRGLTGFFGALDFALVDIGMGLLELVKTKAKTSQVPYPRGVHAD